MPVVGKRLWVHITAPLQAETPLEQLARAELTPLQDLYVRDNVDLVGAMSLEPVEQSWQVELVGLLGKPVTLSRAALAALPQREVEMVLQCSGNGRSQFHQMAPVEGAVWQHGALANLRFRGVPLETVLEACQLETAARYLTARGRGSQSAGEPAFERSVPLDDVLDSALLALELNGRALPGLHGGPVRLILPGYYGVNNVKWLDRLIVAAQPSPNHYQLERYRLPLEPLAPGSTFTPTPDNSRSSWRQNVKSLIFSPLQDDRLPSCRVTVTGVAWNDGRSPIAEVWMSADEGSSWQRAELSRPTSLYAWTRFELELTLEPGRCELWARAKDASGEMQPLDSRPFWNPDGYEWNGIHKVGVTVS